MQVTSRNWGGKLPLLDAVQLAQLSYFGYAIPKPNEEENASKSFNGSAREMAEEIEKIFHEVFGLTENYDVLSSGVFQ